MATYTGSATELKTSRNGSSWRSDYPYAGQGKNSYDSKQRVGYIKFNFQLENTNISRIKLTFTYDTAGSGAWDTKTLGLYSYRNSCSPSSYTDTYLLGTIKSKNQYNCTTTFTLSSSGGNWYSRDDFDDSEEGEQKYTAVVDSAKSLFNKMKAYLESGKNELVICRPNDGTYASNNYTNYLLIKAASIEITYENTHNMNINYKVNGVENGYGEGYVTAGTFDATVGGVTVADDAIDLNYRAVSGTSYRITANKATGWRCQNSPVNGTYPSNDFSVVLDFRQEYIITYNNGGGGTKPSNQTKVNGTALTLRSAMTRPNTSPGNYTVSLVPQNGESNSTLTATRTTSYTFRKWKSTAGTEYSGGGSYTTESATTMTAQWNSTTVTSAVTLPTLTKPGYAFMGWSTSPTATSGVSGNYVPSSNVTLYGIWEPEGLVNIDNGSSFNPHTIWIDNGTSWDQYMAYLDTGTEWVLCNE